VRAGMSTYATGIFYKMFEFMESSGFWDNPGVLEWLLGRKAHRFEAWFSAEYEPRLKQ